jgi:Stage II sporulation protein E (SpoIIE)
LNHERVDALSRALRSAPSYAALDTLRDELDRRFNVELRSLLMADYGLTVLQPVIELPRTAEPPIPLKDTLAGQAFSSQAPTVEPSPDGATLLVNVPVSVRGDRLGILVLACHEPLTASLLEELADLGTVLGHEITVAERDTDLYLQARRRKRLTLAAEMQWQLLPGRGCARTEYVMGAQLEPAYAVGSDNFDWSTDAEHLLVAVSTGSGSGMESALLTNLGVNALRNARRAGVTLADQASLADQAIYAEYGGRLFMSSLLLGVDIARNEVAVIDAGSPHLYRLRHDHPELLAFDAQLPLGMFEGTQYDTQSLTLEPDDRLVVISDDPFRAASHPAVPVQVLTALSATRQMGPADAANAILHELVRDGAANTDITVLCLDWHNRL